MSVTVGPNPPTEDQQEEFTAAFGQLPKNRAVVDAAFSSFGIFPTIGNTVGSFKSSETVAEYAKRVNSAIIGAGVVWVDPVNGNDANSGTASLPLRTLDYAASTPSASLVMCMPGTYPIFDFRATDAQGAKLKIFKALGRCVVSEPTDSAAAATWTADGTYTNCWWMPTTPGQKAVLVVTDSYRKDEEGQPWTLTKYASLALLDGLSAGDGWYFDSGANKLYVKYVAGINVNTIKTRLSVVKGDSTSRILVYGTKILFEGNWGFEGVFLQPLVYLTSRPVLCMDIFGGDVTVSYTVSHALDSLGADSYISGAWFHKAQGDNFHYADNSGYSCNAFEIDCKATYAGDISTNPSAPNTSNGSSIHGGANIVRINGVYRRNYGPDIVDTGTGKSWNCGVAQGPAMDSGNAYGIYTTGPEMWLDTCSAVGNEQADIAAVTGGTIHQFATSYRTSTGPVDGYAPGKP